MRIGSTVALFCSVSLVLLTTGCSDREDSVPPSQAPPLTGAIKITVDLNGVEAGGDTTTDLTCSDADGLCHDLLASVSDLNPMPPDQMCTMEYGGPETGSIVGEVEGRRIALQFNRTNGCEISRFDDFMESLANLEDPITVPLSQGGSL